MFCKNCGKLLNSDDKFCPECGTRIVAEKPKAAPLEPMFFVEKREEPVVEKKPKKVVHLDEFQWNLDGFPTEQRKTEAVDFDWASVLETKNRREVEKPAAPPESEMDSLGEMPRTVEELLAALPDDIREMIEETEVQEEELAVDESATEASAAEEPVIEVQEEAVIAEEEIEVKSLEQIIEDFGEGPMAEPTRLIDKAQMKAESVDRFYVFSKKQAEYQSLLDQEYDKIQNGLLEKEEEEDVPTPTVEEILAAVVTEVPEETPVEEPIEVSIETPTEIPTEAPAPTAPEETEPAPVKEELKLVAIAWSMPPAGIIVEREAEAVSEVLKEQSQETEAEEIAEPAAPSEEEVVKEEKEHLTFAEIFNDEDDEEEESRKGGGCLKFIAVVLMVLVLVEVGILGIQYFAKDSQAAQFINQTYGRIINLITGNDDVTPQEETPEPTSEVTLLISAQQSKNENITEIVENKDLIFVADQDYGYEELPNTYEFKDSPWYANEEGKEVTYGEEIIGALILYYSALPDKINGVNKDVLDYVDNTTPLYEELDLIEGDETRGYKIERLEIGQIKTGQKGFYVLVNVTSSDQLQPEKTQQKQLVYLEADPSNKVIKIKETKNI